ncbi:MAG: hypothetical protein Kow00121_38140 [Elainellaceae cyanobacterium]
MVELGIVSEALQLAVKELTQKHEQLMSIQNKVEVERQQYYDLFDLISDGYLVTDPSLVIQRANAAAAALFNIQHAFLIGRPITSFACEDDRPTVKEALAQLGQQNQINLTIRFQRQPDEVFSADCCIKITAEQENLSPVYHWVLQDKTHQKEGFTLEDASRLYDNRQVHSYSKGDLIPLKPDHIWFVCRGVAKLTAMSNHGEEMLVGLVQDSMIFGAPLTVLKTYQATAISRIQLVSIPLTELTDSPQLAQALLYSISQRLQQAEGFLSIYGQLRVEERFNHLLALLKQEIGQPIKGGVRLRVRLTHQDLASLCCTTRVTITRLLGKLQQAGKIALDSHNHLILKE